MLELYEGPFCINTLQPGYTMAEFKRNPGSAEDGWLNGWMSLHCHDQRDKWGRDIVTRHVNEGLIKVTLQQERQIMGCSSYSNRGGDHLHGDKWRQIRS